MDFYQEFINNLLYFMLVMLIYISSLYLNLIHHNIFNILYLTFVYLYQCIRNNFYNVGFFYGKFCRILVFLRIFRRLMFGVGLRRLELLLFT